MDNKENKDKEYDLLPMDLRYLIRLPVELAADKESYEKVFNIIEDSFVNDSELHKEVKNNVWTWENYEDNSGHLRAPDGSTYFGYDWDTKEYKVTEKHGWDSFIGAPDEDSSFSAFKEYAEDYVKKFIAKTENIKFDSKNIVLEEEYELQNKQSLIEKTIETFNDAGYIVNKANEKEFALMLSNLLEIDNYSLSWDDEDGVLIVHNDNNTKEVLDEKVIDRLIHNWSVSIKDRNDSEENWQLELLEKTQKHHEKFLHDNKNIVTYSVTFPCGFTFPKDIIGNEGKMEEYRNKVYSELKEKYVFHDNDAETEYFPDEKYPSFNINFAAPVPIESMEPVFATDIWVDNVCEEIKKEYGANFNFQGGERSEREFESPVAVKKEIARLSAEHCGYYKWDDIFTLALETGPQDRELKAKDNAREWISVVAIKFGIDIENSESPEEAIEDFMEEHPEFDRFDEDGKMIDFHSFEKLNVHEYFNKNLPEGIEPLDSEKLKILEDYIELEGDDLYINKKEDKIYRVWNSHTDDFDPSKPDVNLLHESGPADICFYVSKTAEDLWHKNLEDRENVLAEENKKIMDYFNNLEKDIRAYEFAELNQCGVSELDSADEFRLFQIVLEKYNEKALGLKGGNDDYFNLMVRIGPENRVSDIWIALYDGNNDVKDFRYSDNLPDFEQDVLKRALPLVDSYMNASLEHDIVCDYVFPESFNYSDANGNQKVITIYEEPRWVFRNENKLFEILNADAGDIFDEINELKAKYPDKHFNFDIGKSLRYDDFDLWQGKDLSEESLSDKLDNFYMLRYWDDEGNITNFDYPYEFYMSDKELSDKLNLMIKNHVAENINNFQTYKSFRDVRVKQLLKEQFTKLMDPLHENANRNGYYLEAASVISKELMYHLGIPEDMMPDSDGIRKAVCYSIWKSFGCPVNNDNKINFLDENNTVYVDKVLVTEDEYKVIDTFKFSELGEAPFKKHLEKVISDTMDEITSEIVQQPLCNNTNLEKLIREEIENNYNLKQNEKGEFVNYDNSSSYKLQTYSLSTELEKALGLYGNKITYKGKEYPAIYSLHRTYAIGKDGKIDFSRFNGDSVSLYEGADVPDENGNLHEVMFSDWPLDDIACRINGNLKNDISAALSDIFDRIASEQSETPLPEIKEQGALSSKNWIREALEEKLVEKEEREEDTARKASQSSPENIIDSELKISSAELAGEKYLGQLKMKLPFYKNDPWLTTKIILDELKKTNPEENKLLHDWFNKTGLKDKKDYQKLFDKVMGKKSVEPKKTRDDLVR